MDKKELNEIVAIKNVDTITIALKNRGWKQAENHPIAGELSLIDLFKSKETISSKYAKDETSGYNITLYDNVPYGEKWHWLVLFVDERLKSHYKPKAIRIFIKEK